MVRIGELEAWIEVDGEVATEYTDDEFETDNKTQASKYIEAVAGARFEIKGKVQSRVHLRSGHQQSYLQVLG